MRAYYSKGGLREWVKQKWVDIGAPKKNGKYQPCGRSKGSKRKYPKCVPLAKAGGGMIRPMYGSGGQVAGLARKRRIGCA